MYDNYIGTYIVKTYIKYFVGNLNLWRQKVTGGYYIEIVYGISNNFSTVNLTHILLYIIELTINFIPYHIAKLLDYVKFNLKGYLQE